MSRRYFLGFAISVVTATTYAQTQVEYNTVQNVRIFAPAFALYNTVEGSPYVPNDTVQNGWLLHGVKRVNTKLRYNSYTGEVEYIDGDKLVTPTIPIAEFMIMAADTMHFQRGFPSVGTRFTSNFYQVIFDGRKTKLVRYIYTTIKSDTDAMSNDFGKKKFLSRDEYYVWVANEKLPTENQLRKLSDGKMKSVMNNKKSLIEALPGKAAFVDHYLADQKLKLKSWSEFVKVLRYLETQ